MTNTNVYRGRKANKSGEYFEALISVTCNFYKRIGVADIQKTPEPMRVIRPLNSTRNTFEAHFVKQAQPDFKGVINGGRAILFEAKRTTTTSIAQSRITEEQAMNLNSASELGALCFVLVEMDRKFYAVPWQTWEDMQTIYQKKSLNQKDLEVFEVPFKNGIIEFLKDGAINHDE